MLRPFPALPLAVLVTLVAAQPAPASRIYAGQPRASVPTEIVLSLSDSGAVLNKVIFHFDISCGTTYSSVDSGSTTSVAAAPYALYFGDHYLVGARVRGSSSSSCTSKISRSGGRTSCRVGCVSGSASLAR